MASKSIDIKIASHFNADGVLEANKGLAKLAQDVKGVNDEMRKATMRAEMSVNSYAEQADKAARAMGGGYKTAEEFAKEAIKQSGEAAKAVGKIGSSGEMVNKVFSVLRGSSEGLVGILSQFGKVISGLGFAPILAIASAFKLVSAGVSAAIKNVKAASEYAEKAKQAKYEESLKAISKAQDEVNSALSRASDAIDKASEKQKKLLDLQRESVKAELELAKQKELNAAKGDGAREVIERRYASKVANVDSDFARRQLTANIGENESRIKANKDYIQKMGEWFALADKEIADLEAKTAATREHARQAKVHGSVTSEDYYMANSAEGKEYAKQMSRLEELRAERKKGESNVALAKERIGGYQSAVDDGKQRLKNIEALDEARRLSDERYVADKEKQIKDEANKEAEAARKSEEDRLKAIEAERAAREKMEKELHAQRVADLNAEANIAKANMDATNRTISSAQSEFDKAFAMYRSEDKGAAQIAEERDYGRDYKQLQKDARRYGGKWRIDELSSLIAAGDTAGQISTLEEWRKSKSFTPEVESMVRAAAADQTRTTAEDELRKINANTADLAEKLDELIRMK